MSGTEELTQYFDFTDSELIRFLREGAVAQPQKEADLLLEAARRLEFIKKAQESAADAMTRAHHKKRGTDYFVAPFELNLQCSGRISEGTMLTMYVDQEHATTKIYARPTYEFNDGRFEITKPFEDKSCAGTSSGQSPSQE